MQQNCLLPELKGVLPYANFLICICVYRPMHSCNGLFLSRYLSGKAMCGFRRLQAFGNVAGKLFFQHQYPERYQLAVGNGPGTFCFHHHYFLQFVIIIYKRDVVVEKIIFLYGIKVKGKITTGGIEAGRKIIHGYGGEF